MGATLSVLFIENEQDAQHLFARQRVTLLCEAGEVDRNGEIFPYIMQLFTHKFSKFIDCLQERRDFHLFCLHPVRGAYIAGFGRTFTLEDDDLSNIGHVGDTGHRTTASSA
jgi:putative heme iron utilization protein